MDQVERPSEVQYSIFETGLGKEIEMKANSNQQTTERSLTSAFGREKAKEFRWDY